MPSQGSKYVPEASPDLPEYYSVEAILDSNGAETVYLVHDRQRATKFLGKQVAYFAESAADHSEVIGQTYILKYIDHDTILKVHDIFYAPYKCTYTLVAEYLPHTLAEIVDDGYRGGKKLAEAIIWDYIAQMVDALVYLHSPWNKSYRDNQGDIVQIGRIVHRHLNPKSILFTNLGRLKLSNFTLPTSAEVMRSHVSPLDLAFVAPEVLSGDQIYSLKSDMWSLGCVIYYMCTGMQCFKGNSADEVINSVLNNRHTPIRDLCTGYSDAMLALVERLLHTKPVDRPTANELLDHPIIYKAMRSLGMISRNGSTYSNSPQLEQPPIASSKDNAKNVINLVSPSIAGITFQKVELDRKPPTTAIKSALSTIPLTSSISNSRGTTCSTAESIDTSKLSVMHTDLVSSVTSHDNTDHTLGYDDVPHQQSHQQQQQPALLHGSANAAEENRGSASGPNHFMNRSSTLSLHPLHRLETGGYSQLIMPNSSGNSKNTANLRDPPNSGEMDEGRPAVAADAMFGDGYELTSSISAQDAYPYAGFDPRHDHTESTNEPVVSAGNPYFDAHGDFPKNKNRRKDSAEGGSALGFYEGVLRSDTYCYDDYDMAGTADAAANLSKMQQISDSDRDDSDLPNTSGHHDIRFSMTPHMDQMDGYDNVLRNQENYDDLPFNTMQSNQQEFYQSPFQETQAGYHGSEQMSSESIREAIAKAKHGIAMDQSRVQNIDVPQTGDNHSVIATNTVSVTQNMAKSVRIGGTFNTDNIFTEAVASQLQANGGGSARHGVHDSKTNETLSTISMVRASRIKPTVESFQSRMEANIATRKTGVNTNDIDRSVANFSTMSMRDANTMSMRTKALVSQRIYNDNSFNNTESEYYTMGTGPSDVQRSQVTASRARLGATDNANNMESYTTSKIFGDRPYLAPAESKADTWHSTTINGIHPTMSFRQNIQEDSSFKGWTPLMEAVVEGSIQDVQEALTWTGAQDNNGLTALMLAVMHKKIDAIKILLPHEKQIQDKVGWTALMWAAHYNEPHIIDLLLTETTMKDIYGRTALMIGAQNGFLEVVSRLAQPEACTQRKDGYTALMHAASRGVVDVSYIHTDREFGRPYHLPQPTESDQSIIELVALTKRGTEQDYIDIVSILHAVESGLTSNKLCTYGAGLTALMIASIFDFAPACSILHESEGKLYQSDEKCAEDYAQDYNSRNAQDVLQRKMNYKLNNFVEAEVSL